MIKDKITSLFKGHKHLGKLCVACAAVVLMFAITIVNAQMCYNVSLNGEEIGVVKSKAELEGIIAGAEEKASDILGYEYKMEDRLVVSANLGASYTNEQAITSAILDNVDGISQMYAILVDGVPVGAADNRGDLNDILQGFLKEYSCCDDPYSVSFSQDVFVDQCYVSEELTTDVRTIKNLLDPKNKGSEYSLDVECREFVQITREVNYETEIIEDDSLYQDDVTIVREGVSGEEAVSGYTVYVNGKQANFEELISYISIPPVSEQIICGTKEGSRTDSTGTFIWPIEGIITSNFGYRSVRVGSSFHKGIDINANMGDDVAAADGGEVIYADWMNGYGNLVQILHDNGDVTYYGHLSGFNCAVGDRVAQGDIIAYAGNTGVSSSPHLHFELRLAGTEQVDPLGYLPQS